MGGYHGNVGPIWSNKPAAASPGDKKENNFANFLTLLQLSKIRPVLTWLISTEKTTLFKCGLLELRDIVIVNTICLSVCPPLSTDVSALQATTFDAADTH